MLVHTQRSSIVRDQGGRSWHGLGRVESSWGDSVPESLENQKLPLYMAASTKVPSLDEVTACHLGGKSCGRPDEYIYPPDGVVPVTSVQVAPVSVE